MRRCTGIASRTGRSPCRRSRDERIAITPTVRVPGPWPPSDDASPSFHAGDADGRVHGSADTPLQRGVGRPRGDVLRAKLDQARRLARHATCGAASSIPARRRRTLASLLRVDVAADEAEPRLDAPSKLPRATPRVRLVERGVQVVVEDPDGLRQRQPTPHLGLRRASRVETVFELDEHELAQSRAIEPSTDSPQDSPRSRASGRRRTHASMGRLRAATPDADVRVVVGVTNAYQPRPVACARSEVRSDPRTAGSEFASPRLESARPARCRGARPTSPGSVRRAYLVLQEQRADHGRHDAIFREVPVLGDGNVAPKQDLALKPLAVYFASRCQGVREAERHRPRELGPQCTDAHDPPRLRYRQPLAARLTRSKQPRSNGLNQPKLVQRCVEHRPRDVDADRNASDPSLDRVLVRHFLALRPLRGYVGGKPSNDLP